MAATAKDILENYYQYAAQQNYNSHFVRSLLRALPADHITILGLDGIKHLVNQCFQSLTNINQQHEDISISVFNTTHYATQKDLGTTLLVAGPDYSFNTDSLLSELKSRGVEVEYMLYGTSQHAPAAAPSHQMRTSFPSAVTYMQLTQVLSFEEIEALEKNIYSIYEELRAVNQDYGPSLELLHNSMDAMQPEHRELCQWLEEEHFKFWGATLSTDPNNAYGLLRTPPYASSFLSGHAPNLIDIHPTAPLIDEREPFVQINIPLKNKEQTLTLVGAFTRKGRGRHISTVPVVREKLERVIGQLEQQDNFLHHKEAYSVLESFPLRELFLMAEEELLKRLQVILSLPANTLSKVFISPLPQGLSLVALINEKSYNDKLKNNIIRFLQEELSTLATHHTVKMTPFGMARLHVVLPLSAQETLNEEALRKGIESLCRSWEDAFKTLCVQNLQPLEAERLWAKYAPAFSDIYKTQHTPEEALEDLTYLESLLTNDTALRLNVSIIEEEPSTAVLVIYKKGAPLTLDKLYPLLQNMGLNIQQETPYNVNFLRVRDDVWIHNITVTSQGVPLENLHTYKDVFVQAFYALWHSETPVDPLNSLTLKAGLCLREIDLLRLFVKYLRQLNFSFSGGYILKALVNNHALTHKLVAAFHYKFNPREGALGDASAFAAYMEPLLEEISDIEHPDTFRVFSRLANLLEAALRTNFFKKDGATHKALPYISIKFRSNDITDIPKPVPYAEIFVYSDKLEGVHLRSGPVSRGGLRWSDRAEDFRTEVLALVKAQNVKNAVIVPQGSKGCFYVKTPSPTRDDAIAAYKQFIKGLLDITDNRVDSQVVTPPNVVAYDGPDSYLVVAADKGTATFSDIANSISQDYNFWLGDAFASGGSQGYDHKKMGITSRGAWEAAKRHCHEELGKHPEKDPITVVGIGDLSGDVFGNGVLLSRTILLQAAFNHQHIFLDPTPDAQKSYDERLRMFKAFPTRWDDYDKSTMSEGGMIISRASKAVELTPQVKAFLQTERDVLSPNDIIRLILKAPVDMLWFGGIGTFIKAAHENNHDVSDKANDDIRVNGKEVQAKIIVEGANLGITQQGRIEYALKGGRINTDALDNSAGVDCSDHEVNIKILLAHVMQQKKLTQDQRNVLLEKMESTVATHVLQHNYLQNIAISLAEYEKAAILEEHAQLMARLERAEFLDPELEFLPEEEEIEKRAGKNLGLTRPELCVLLLYVKNYYFQKLMAMPELLDDPYCNRWLYAYFPQELHNDFSAFIEAHPLRREIIATQIVNEIINRTGMHFIARLMFQTGKSFEEILLAYVVTRHLFDMESTWERQQTFEAMLTGRKFLSFITLVRRLFTRSCLWLLTHLPNKWSCLTDLITSYEGTFLRVLEQFEATAPTYDNAQDQLLEHLHSKLRVLRFTTMPFAHAKHFEDSLQHFVAVGELFGFSWLFVNLEETVPESFWHKMLLHGTRHDLYDLQGKLTSALMKKMNDEGLSFEQAIVPYHEDIAMIRELVEEIKPKSAKDAWTLSLLARHLRLLTEKVCAK